MKARKSSNRKRSRAAAKPCRAGVSGPKAAAPDRSTPLPEAAAALGLGARTLERHVAESGMPHARGARGEPLVDPLEVAGWLGANGFGRRGRRGSITELLTAAGGVSPKAKTLAEDLIRARIAKERELARRHKIQNEERLRRLADVRELSEGLYSLGETIRALAAHLERQAAQHPLGAKDIGEAFESALDAFERTVRGLPEPAQEPAAA